jgi:hypothetical protein
MGMNNTHGTPAEPAGDPGPAGLTDPYPQYSPVRSRKKRLLRWGTGITLAGFLAGGGIALAVTGGSSPAAADSTVSGVSGVSGSSQAQGATLNSELNTAANTSATSSARHIRSALGRLRALGGVEGEFTFHNSTGYHTLAFERGTIQSVSGTNVVVRAPDGTTWTWLIVSNTVVRQSGGKTTTSALTAGQPVFAGGPIVNGAKDARLIVIRASSSGSSSSSSVSGPSGTSVS